MFANELSLLGGALVSLVAITVLIRLAPALGLLDRPSVHKTHALRTPFVGGFGLLAALFVGLFFANHLVPELRSEWLWLAVASVTLFAVGLIDDIRPMCFRPRLLVQALVALMMTLGAGVVLHDFGHLWFGTTLALGVLAVPFTVFATIGIINAVNMTDGMDGLAGSLSMITLGILAVLSLLHGGYTHLPLMLALFGGLAAFLYFNLRHPWQPQARVFLGDNGSMLLGLLLIWLVIPATQGEQAFLSPVGALWLLALPVMDTVSVILRRLWLRESPFKADRNHLHHFMERAGFRVQGVVGVVATLHLLLAGAGLGLLAAGVPEWAMLMLFLGVLSVYAYLTVRPWRAVPALRRLHGKLGLVPNAVAGIYIGHEGAENPERLRELIAGAIDEGRFFRLRVFEWAESSPHRGTRYALVEVPWKHEHRAPLEAAQLSRRIARAATKAGMRVRARPMVWRNAQHDRRFRARDPAVERRANDRRGAEVRIQVYDANVFAGYELHPATSADETQRAKGPSRAA